MPTPALHFCYVANEIPVSNSKLLQSKSIFTVNLNFFTLFSCTCIHQCDQRRNKD